MKYLQCSTSDETSSEETTEVPAECNKEEIDALHSVEVNGEFTQHETTIQTQLTTEKHKKPHRKRESRDEVRRRKRGRKHSRNGSEAAHAGKDSKHSKSRPRRRRRRRFYIQEIQYSPL